jgi:sortase A
MTAITIVRRQGPRVSVILRWTSYLFLAAGICALGYVVYVYASGYAFQKMAPIAFSSRPPKAPAVERLLAEGRVIGRIQIERLGLSAVVAQGDSPSVLRRAVGHVPGTALPGEDGNIALAGHRDTFFRALRRTREGDVITIATAEGEYQYEVQFTAVVPPTDMQVLRSSGKEELTLITCYPFFYIGPAPDRFVVRALRTQQSPN